jgi:DNA-directed RNA polymerase
VIGILEEYGNEFYLTHRYDKRGRVYCQGYHISYQGNAWNKSVIELADKEIIEL